MSILATDKPWITPPTSAGQIAVAAELIRNHGYAPHDAGDDIRHKGHTILTAAAAAIGGPGARPDSLTEPQRAALTAAQCSLESALGCSLKTWERIHAVDDAWTIAWHLDQAAVNVLRREAAGTCEEAPIARLRIALAVAA